MRQMPEKNGVSGVDLCVSAGGRRGLNQEDSVFCFGRQRMA